MLLVSSAGLRRRGDSRTLIEALPRTLSGGVGVRLVLVGEGPLRSALEAQVAAAQLTGAVNFLGFRSDVADILNASDIVIAPSLWKACPSRCSRRWH